MVGAMSEISGPTVIDSTGEAGLTRARELLDGGGTVVLVCGPDLAGPAGELTEGSGRLAVLVDDGNDRSDAVVAAMALAREMFASEGEPSVERS